jgi:hypothetical protein
MLKANAAAVDALTFQRLSANPPNPSSFPIHGVVAALSFGRGLKPNDSEKIRPGKTASLKFSVTQP